MVTNPTNIFGGTERALNLAWFCIAKCELNNNLSAQTKDFAERILIQLPHCAVFFLQKIVPNFPIWGCHSFTYSTNK